MDVLNKHYGFNVEVAKKLGVNCAIMLQNLEFWTKHNEANDLNFFDGRYWTYNSVKAFAAIFPFWTTKQVRTILEKLEKNGYIVSGCYNKAYYDKTKWYSVNAFAQTGKTPLPKRANEIAQSGKPIPDINTDIKPDLKHSSKNEFLQLESPKKEVNSLMSIFWEKNKSINYANKTERKACEWLIEQVGIDKAMLICKIMINVEQGSEGYPPLVTRPIDIKNKWGQIQAYISRKKEVFNRDQKVNDAYNKLK